MAANISPELLRRYPPELIQFTTDEAVRDAEDVAALLDAAGLGPPPGETRGYPPGILLDLGAVVRLRRWEAAGCAVHVEAGFPTARGALHHVISILIKAAENRESLTTAGTLSQAVTGLMVTRLAWTARSELGSDVELDITDEEALVESLAQFLWSHRHDILFTK
jgi:hypothetical protein